jgi:nucleotide-binding universal stress UspA family protein
MSADHSGPSAAVAQPLTVERILVAYDASGPSDRALDLAIRMARFFGATLAVLSVVPYRPGRPGQDPWDDEALHQSELAAARALLRDRNFEAKYLLESGDVATTIERVIVEGGFDTVVLGSRGLRWAARALQGSVSEHVVTHSRATVVVTH